MKTKIKNIKGCTRMMEIELSNAELSQQFDRVYADIGKSARIPGFRPGKAPRDLLEAHYAGKAKEEVIRRAIPEYYLLAVKEQELSPVAPPEIEAVQLKKETLLFSAKIDVVPQVKLKSYKGLKIIKKKIKLEQDQLDQALERLRQQKKPLPELNDQFAQNLGFKSLQELRETVRMDLQANAEMQLERDMENQLMQQLLQRASLDIPESLVNNQTEESLRQLKINCILRGEKKEQVEPKENQLREQAKQQAIQRVRLSFVLDKIAQLENVQVEEKELKEKIAEIARRFGKSEAQTRAYLDRENLLPGLQAELKNRKTIQLLLTEANLVEEK